MATLTAVKIILAIAVRFLGSVVLRCSVEEEEEKAAVAGMEVEEKGEREEDEEEEEATTPDRPRFH